MKPFKSLSSSLLRMNKHKSFNNIRKNNKNTQPQIQQRQDCHDHRIQEQQQQEQQEIEQNHLQPKQTQQLRPRRSSSSTEFVEISHGKFVKLIKSSQNNRGSNNNNNNNNDDTMTILKCIGCSRNFRVPLEYEIMYCAKCKTMTPRRLSLLLDYQPHKDQDHQQEQPVDGHKNSKGQSRIVDMRRRIFQRRRSSSTSKLGANRKVGNSMLSIARKDVNGSQQQLENQCNSNSIDNVHDIDCGSPSSYLYQKRKPLYSMDDDYLLDGLVSIRRQQRELDQAVQYDLRALETENQRIVDELLGEW